MDTNTGRLKNSLSGADDPPDNQAVSRTNREHEEPKPARSSRKGEWVVLIFIILLFVYASNSYKLFSFSPLGVVKAGVESINQPSDDLLNRMGAQMAAMGYGNFTHDELRSLRREGLTATYVSNVRALGYTDLTLEDAARMAKANASSAFIAMMIELGYPLDVDDILRLRNAGVTAHYTSTIHDLGYRDVTIDQLIRMQRIGVTPALISNLQEERGENIALEEIIRHRISNQ